MSVLQGVEVRDIVHEVRSLLVPDLALPGARLAHPDGGPAGLPPPLHLHPGSTPGIELGGNKIFLSRAVLLLHSPFKDILPYSASVLNNSD